MKSVTVDFRTVPFNSTKIANNFDLFLKKFDDATLFEGEDTFSIVKWLFEYLNGIFYWCR